MNKGPRTYSDVETCVEDTLSTVGQHIKLGTPLGLGKANHLVNEFFRRAKEDSKINLHIFTALSLDRPQWKGELERRFLEPLSERLFGGYPSLKYVDFVRRGRLPDNIRVSEFYFQPGSFLDSPLAQQSYMSSNYTHAVRDILGAGINVLAQLVSKDEQDGVVCYSLSCNPDLTLDLVPPVRKAKRQGAKIALLAQVNCNLPFMYGDAAVSANYFDAILEGPKYEFPLFGTPNRPVDTAEYLIALHTTALIRDGGTIQIGIGALEDAVTYLLKLRHEQNDLYREMLIKTGILERFGGTIERIGGTNRFERGLYGSSEMLVDGFLELYRSGILRRKVYQDARLQWLLNDNHITEEVTPAKLDLLVENGIISGEIKEGCLEALRKGGHVAHACFFLGPGKFYENLRQLSAVDRKQICMTAISYVNQLFGNEELKRLQRRAARFINTGLIVTLTGAVASDGLEDGRVLSGVGGQYNFVAMAHELEDGRSIIMIRSTKEQNGKTLSNIRWNYGHITIPRHLRDIVVTEYGIAEIRGRSDAEVIAALLEIADSRFQDKLLDEAKRAGKIRQNYLIPDYARNNRPERLEKILAPYRERGLFPQFPFGTDLTEEENTLRKALLVLKQMSEGHKLRVPQLTDLRKTLLIPDQAHSFLARMELRRPKTIKERLMQRALVYALASIRAI
jgi:acyl-CoA hydrolase